MNGVLATLYPPSKVAKPKDPINCCPVTIKTAI